MRKLGLQRKYFLYPFIIISGILARWREEKEKQGVSSRDWESEETARWEREGRTVASMPGVRSRLQMMQQAAKAQKGRLRKEKAEGNQAATKGRCSSRKLSSKERGRGSASW